jgi:hypothetical protein
MVDFTFKDGELTDGMNDVGVVSSHLAKILKSLWVTDFS